MLYYYYAAKRYVGVIEITRTVHGRRGGHGIPLLGGPLVGSLEYKHAFVVVICV